MSRIGLLFSPEERLEGRPLPQVGHAARVVLRLPGSGQERGRYVECLGRVVRLEEQENSRRIAIEFRRYQFTAHPPRAITHLSVSRLLYSSVPPPGGSLSPAAARYFTTITNGPGMNGKAV